MTAFWCETHDASAPHEKALCWYAVAKMNDRSGWSAGPCRVERKRMVALDGIDVEGLREAIECLNETEDSRRARYAVADVLAALEGETDGD